MASASSQLNAVSHNRFTALATEDMDFCAGGNDTTTTGKINDQEVLRSTGRIAVAVRGNDLHPSDIAGWKISGKQAKVIQEFKEEAAMCKERYEEFLRTGKRKADYAEDVGESLTKSLQAVLAAATKPKPKPKEDDLGSLLDSYLSLKPARIADDSSKKPEDEKSIDALLSFASRRKEERVSGDAPSSVKVLPEATKQANQPSEPEKPKVDLEDWLDSVLND